MGNRPYLSLLFIPKDITIGFTSLYYLCFCHVLFTNILCRTRQLWQLFNIFYHAQLTKGFTYLLLIKLRRSIIYIENAVGPKVADRPKIRVEVCLPVRLLSELGLRQVACGRASTYQLAKIWSPSVCEYPSTQSATTDPQHLGSTGLYSTCFKSNKTSQCWASSLGSRRDATRICCWAWAPAGDANAQQQIRPPPRLLSFDGTDRRTDGRPGTQPLRSSMLRILGGQPAQYPEFACDNAERDVFYVCVFSLFIYPFVYYVFTYLPKCEVDNSQSKLHSACSRQAR